MELYERILNLCKSKDITVSQLCQIIGISNSSIYNLKNAGRKTISAKATSKIADFFGISVSYLLYGEESVKLDSTKIPVYGVISAGLPSLAEQEIIDYEEIPAALARSGEYYALQVKGDSMEPRMFAGDVVILRKTSEFESGKICAVGINGDEATLKRVYVRQNGITLFALNSKYDPINFNAAQIENLPVVCMGVCVEVRGKLML